MKAEYVNSFFEATINVFRLMLDLDVQKGNLSLAEGMVSSKDANAVLGVTGNLSGTILFSFPKDMALEMVKIMSGMEMKEIDSFVSSALGEVANIIGGNAMTILNSHNYLCDIVPPHIFVGEFKSFSLADEKVLILPLETKIGVLDIHISLKEQ